MNKIRQSINCISCGLVSIATIVLPMTMTSCSSSGIVFGDYESYISPNLINTLHSKYGVNMMYYSTNEDIQAKFKNSYDIAVPSTYTVLDMIPQLAEYNWSKFNVYSNQYNPITGGSHTLITHATPTNWNLNATSDSTNAMCLFSKSAIAIINYVDKYAHSLYESSEHKKGYADDKTILNYAIPYFLQDIMMAYHGDYIAPNPSTNFKGLPAPELDPVRNLNYQSDVNWSDLTNVIAPKVWNGGKNYGENSNWDPRFQPINNNHLGMVDDSRTFYDICHIIDDEQNSIAQPGVNPDKDPLDVKSIQDTYSKFTSKFNPNTIYLNTDSQQVLYPFANPKNINDHNTLAQSNAAIFYSGDCLYAAMGAGVDAWSDVWHAEPTTVDGPLTQGNFHIVKPKDSLVCMDMVVMNKKDVGSKKEDHIYDAIRKVTLDGCDQEPRTTDGIGSYEGDSDSRDFQYGPMDNFYEVGYTSPLYSVDTYIARDISTDPEYSFFDSIYSYLDDEDRENKAELLAEINNINFQDGLLEAPLSNLTKSNMSMVYQQYKEKM